MKLLKGTYQILIFYKAKETVDTPTYGCRRTQPLFTKNFQLYFLSLSIF